MNFGGFLDTVLGWLSGAKQNVETVKQATNTATYNQQNPPPFKRGPLAEPSPGLRKLFNDSHWQVPDIQKSVGMPSKSFDLGASQTLAPHTYNLEVPEWKRVQDYYTSENAEAWGWGAPTAESLAGTEPLDLSGIDWGTGPGSGNPNQPAKPVQVNPNPTEQETNQGLEDFTNALTQPGGPKITEENYTAAPLTWEAYSALPSEQKSAIDWNTLLIEAREKDLAREAAPPKVPDAQARAEYDEKVKNIFGETGGSQVYAPNTVTLLDNLGIKAQGQDLDEYLGLNRAITSTEMGDVKFTSGQLETIDDLMKDRTLTPEQVTQYSKVRDPGNVRLLDNQAIEAAGREIKAAMTNPDLNLWSFEAAIPGLIGDNKKPVSAAVPLGYGTPEIRGGGAENIDNQMDVWLNTAYEHLKSDQTDPQDLWDAMKERQFTPEDVQTFFQFMDTKLSNEERYGETPAPEGRPGKSRTAEEIRRILGWEE